MIVWFHPFCENIPIEKKKLKMPENIGNDGKKKKLKFKNEKFKDKNFNM